MHCPWTLYISLYSASSVSQAQVGFVDIPGCWRLRDRHAIKASANYMDCKQVVRQNVAERLRMLRACVSSSVDV